MNFQNKLKKAIDSDTPSQLLVLALGAAGCCSDRKLIDIITKLASISKSEFTDKISTAAISACPGGVKLMFNRNFMETYVTTPACLLFVICHELMHKIKGDIYKRPASKRDRDIWNIAFDLIINGILSRKFFTQPVPLLEKLYRNSALPVRLLNHPEKITAPELLAGIKYPGTAELVSHLHTLVWTKEPNSITAHDMVEDIVNSLYGPEQRPVDIELLLGSHDEPENERGAFAEWLKNKLRDVYTGPGTKGARETLSIRPEPKRIYKFYDMVRRAMSPDSSHPVLKEQLLPELGFVPYLQRKESFYLSAGYIPPFYQSPAVKREFNDWRAVVYLDVSGSVLEYQPLLCGLLMNIRDLIGDRLYTFSTVVEETSFEALSKGELVTEYGTLFDAVAEHALEKRYKRILIISDGEGSFTKGLFERLKKYVEVYVILTSSYNRFFCQSIFELAGGHNTYGSRWWQLPKELTEDNFV